MATTPWPNWIESNSSHPAVWISWDDAQAFVGRLNDAADDSLYRLPTEAEWEYACRAGTMTRWSFGDDESDLEKYAWYKTNANGKAHAVGGKWPNAWGLHDMHGNVWEWVQDRYGYSYYEISVAIEVATHIGILGDVNSDGEVDLRDALLVVKYVSDPSIEIPDGGYIVLGDVNDDGDIDLTDASLIELYVTDSSDPGLPPGIGEALELAVQRPPTMDPLGPNTGTNRVVRGGVFNNPANRVRSADRNSLSPDTRDTGVGMRLLRIR